VGVDVGWLVRDVSVGKGRIYVVCRYGDCWFVIVYVGMKCAWVWGQIEAVYVEGGVLH